MSYVSRRNHSKKFDDPIVPLTFFMPLLRFHTIKQRNVSEIACRPDQRVSNLVGTSNFKVFSVIKKGKLLKSGRRGIEFFAGIS